MPNIRPISDLRNYSSLIDEVSYGNRVYLTRNGHGQCALIDIEELDELDQYKLRYQALNRKENGEDLDF